MPELELWERGYVDDFYTLTSSRQIGMGLAPIPISEIIAFVDKVGIMDFEDFLYIINAMDNAYLDEYNKKQAAEQAVQQPKGK